MDASCVSLVIPVYNEHENIPLLFNSILEHIGAGAELLICYDHDGDTTLPVVRASCHVFPHLRAIKNHYGGGVVGAIRSGFDASTRPAVIVMMADLSDDLRCIEPMVNLFKQGYQIVAPSRYMKGGKQEMSGPAFKKALSWLVGVSLHYIAGLPIHDATNNFRLYAKEFLDTVRIESTGGFEIALELTVKGHLAGVKLAEVPAVYHDRRAGQSRFRLWKWLPNYMRWYWLAIRGCRHHEAPGDHAGRDRCRF